MPLPFADNPIGSPFIELQSVDSTNKYAMEQAHAGMAQHGMAFYAHEQTAGKGQRGKNWHSEIGSNLALTIVLKPYPLSISEQFKLSICTAVSVFELFSELAGEETKLKWPNDLYWRDRKAGGILIENIINIDQSETGNWPWAIIGVGININQTVFPEDLPNPVSLIRITGKKYEPIVLAKKLCQIVDKNFIQLQNGDFNTLNEIYQSILYKKEEPVKLKKENRIFEAIIKGVSEQGQLITMHAIEERFDFGEIDWLI